jgi:hypothetical protein
VSFVRNSEGGLEDLEVDESYLTPDPANARPTYSKEVKGEP